MYVAYYFRFDDISLGVGPEVQVGMKETRSSEILRFWRNVEFLLPFQLDAAYDQHKHVFDLSLNSDKPLPWESPLAFGLPSDKVYGFDLFVAPFSLEEVHKALLAIEPKVASETPSDPRALEGLSCLLRVAVEPGGVLVVDDCSLSTLPWALMRLTNGKPLVMAEFDEWARGVVALLTRITLPEDWDDEDAVSLSKEYAPCTVSRLSLLAKEVTDDLPLQFFPNDILAVAVARRLREKSVKEQVVEQLQEEGLREHTQQADTTSVAEKYREELRRRRKVDILNSFYLRDLERAHEFLRTQDLESPLVRYLGTESPITCRVDLLQDQNRGWALEKIAPSQMAAGRWPAPSEQMVSSHQQLAISLYHNSPECLQAVNGPPGTGKTTLVRDLLAHLVVSRAAELAKLRSPGAAFTSSPILSGAGGRNERSIRVLNAKLQGFGLVVASSNNAAVENITLEMPKEQAIAAEFADFSYLAPIAQLYARIRSDLRDQRGAGSSPLPYWGLPCVALGKSSNRRLFVRAGLFFDRDEDDDTTAERRAEGMALTLIEWRRQVSEGTLSFHQAKSAFSALHSEFAAWLKEATSRAQDKAEVHRIMAQQDREWQLRSPWVDERCNILRSRLFSAALALHEAWIREVPFLEGELYALGRFLVVPNMYEPKAAQALWELLTMIVPLVSTTLASVERMFSSMPPKSLGHVIVEEAGQATPQSVCGLLLRARRALFIGDQRQLVPVVTIPDAIVTRLGQHLDDEIFSKISPVTNSAQSVADRVTCVGTEIASSDGQRLWMSTPLRVHRRCGSPMFEIANSIAYEGFMIHAKERHESHSLLGPSAWFQVRGTSVTKQWVPEQGRIAELILEKLLLADEDSSPDVFFVSPFRAVRTQLLQVLKRRLGRDGRNGELESELSRRVGTIHSMQGREASIVVLVLGCDATQGGAAHWAGETPNLLNVAVTRARDLLYVIGDRDVWHNKGFFSDLVRSLPVATVS